MNDIKACSEADAIARIARQVADVKVASVPVDESSPFVIIPSSCQIEFLPVPELPRRPRAKVVMSTANSFIDYLNTYKNNDARIYGSDAGLTALLNDHAGDGSGENTANWRDWRVELRLTESDEWGAWKSKDAERMDQQTFGEFLEEHLDDVIEPDSTALLEVVLNFETTRASAFKSARRLQSGDVNFAWVDETQGGGSVCVPSLFKLSIPVYERGERLNMAARLRYRLSDGKLTLWYELVRPELVARKAFDSITADVTDKTGIKVWYGTP